jgi:hypothetical protein
VTEVPEAVGQSSGLLDEQVDRLGAAVAHSRGGEVRQYPGPPGAQRAAEPGDFGDRAGRGGVEHLLGDLLACGRVGGGVGGAQLLIAGPGQGDLVVGVAGLEARVQPGALLVGEVLGAVPQQPADLVERVVAVPAPAHGGLLHASADLVDHCGAEADDVEGVEHGDGVGQFVADSVGVAAERIEGGVLDPGGELLALLGQPAGVDGARTALHDVE